jgi:hypothetical protein
VLQQEGIKRDEVDSGDYDPFAWKADAVKYSSKHLRDPIKRDLERMYEDRMGPANSTGTIVPRSRNKVMLDPQLYCEEKLISTPYGWHMQLMAGDGKLPHEIAMRDKSYKDSVGPLMDDFTPAPPNNGARAVTGPEASLHCACGSHPDVAMCPVMATGAIVAREAAGYWGTRGKAAPRRRAQQESRSTQRSETTSVMEGGL